ncbi:MAG: nucleotidyltransferase family protein [Candidatus Riflebacteria bacterium]|nr:nucleotidyltransferase family protein [Candidatus Riflebacteria bacterium]
MPRQNAGSGPRQGAGLHDAEGDPWSTGVAARNDRSAHSLGDGQSLPPADRLLVLLTLAAPSSTEAEEALALSGALTARDWRRFGRLLDHNDVGPLVARTARRLGVWERLPAERRTAIDGRRAAVEQRNALRLERAGELFARMAARGLPVIVLKGVAFGETMYGDPAYKKMNDMDLLIRATDIAAVKEVLDGMGMVPLALLDGGEEDPDPRKTHHLPAYVSPDLQFVLGIHWGLASPKAGYRLDHDGIWARRRPLRVAGQEVACLGPLDTLHHLGVHFHYYKTGLKELGDLANVVRAAGTFDWEGFGRLVEEAGTATAVFRPVRLAQALYGIAVPAALLDRWRAVADPFVARDTEALAARSDLLADSRSTWSSQIEKAYLAFTFENRFGPKLAWLGTFWRRLLFPPKAVLRRTNACRRGERSAAWLWLMNLYRTAREVGRDYGLAIFLLLMAKSVTELAATLAAGGGPGRMERLRGQLGQDEAQILAFMDTFD